MWRYMLRCFMIGSLIAYLNSSLMTAEGWYQASKKGVLLKTNLNQKFPQQISTKFKALVLSSHDERRFKSQTFYRLQNKCNVSDGHEYLLATVGQILSSALDSGSAKGLLKRWM